MGGVQPLADGDPRGVGSYRLLGRLGEGGMGCVYLGRSVGGRTVAVKVVRGELARDGEFRARFRREVEAARRVGGVWTAPVLDADTEAEQPWVASGYVAGPSLAQAVGAYGALPDGTVRALGAGLAEALAQVHGMGLIHRDVKPSNVMLSLDGPVLIDFGIARAMDASASSALTRTGFLVGSPGYMSPEQVMDQPLTAASDVFQLGAVLAFAGTGAGPFGADSAASLLYKVAHGEPDLGQLTGGIRDLVTACLAKAPADRPSPAEVAAGLAPAGASALNGDDWLPGAVTAQLGRQAIDLLNLEAGAHAVPQDAPPSAPHRPTVVLSPQQPNPASPEPPALPQPSAPAQPPAPPQAPLGGPAIPPAARRPAPQPGARRFVLPAVIAAAATVAVTVGVVLLTNKGHHAAALGGGGLPVSAPATSAPATSAPATSAPVAATPASVGPLQPAGSLCDRTDPAPLVKVLGPLKLDLQSGAANNNDGTLQRSCRLTFAHGGFDILITYYATPDAARHFYSSTQSRTHTGTDSEPAVAVGDQAEQNLLIDPADTYKCWQYALAVQDANVFVNAYGSACDVPDSKGVQLGLARTVKGILAKLT